MAEQRYALNEGRSVTFDAAGGGTVRIGPGRPGTRWHITTVAISSTSSTAVPTARIYQGATPSPGAFLGGTYTGSQDADTTFDRTLWAGDVITCLFENGDVGAEGTISVFGEILV